jgi:hypothetical protein
VQPEPARAIARRRMGASQRGVAWLLPVRLV